MKFKKSNLVKASSRELQRNLENIFFTEQGLLLSISRLDHQIDLHGSYS